MESFKGTADEDPVSLGIHAGTPQFIPGNSAPLREAEQDLPSPTARVHDPHRVVAEAGEMRRVEFRVLQEPIEDLEWTRVDVGSEVFCIEEHSKTKLLGRVDRFALRAKHLGVIFVAKTPRSCFL